jgi:hypothetical protein
MNYRSPAVLILTALALTILPAAAQQQTTSRPHHHHRIVAKAPSHTRSHRRAAVAPQRQIACTVAGCNPVPRGCHPEPQRYFSGMTTGFDTVVCP